MSRFSIENVPTAIRYVLAGKSIFTLEGKYKRTHYTYYVSISGNGRVYYVVCRLKEGKKYIGIIRNDGKFYMTKNTFMHRDAILGFAYAWGRLINHEWPELVSMYHHGRCGRCGRELTHPKSIDIGLGPACAKRR